MGWLFTPNLVQHVIHYDKVYIVPVLRISQIVVRATNLWPIMFWTKSDTMSWMLHNIYTFQCLYLFLKISEDFVGKFVYSSAVGVHASS